MRWFDDGYGKFPDLRDAVGDATDHDEFENLISFASGQSVKRRKIVISTVIILILTMICVFAITRPSTLLDYIGLAAIVCIFIVAVIDAILERERTVRTFAQLLYQRGIRPNHCIKCKYDLRGSSAEFCPECGEPLAPAAQSEH